LSNAKNTLVCRASPCDTEKEPGRLLQHRVPGVRVTGGGKFHSMAKPSISGQPDIAALTASL
jgi:hypothetical protein